jgi:hypothetical protein
MTRKWQRFFDAWAYAGLIIFSALLLMIIGDKTNMSSLLERMLR